MTTSMTCEQFETILPDLLDDATAATAMTPAVRGHVDSCGECSALFADLHAIRSRAATLPVLAPSRDLWAGVASRIETPIVPLVEGIVVGRPRRHISWRTAGAAAAVLLVANLATVYVLVNRPEAPPREIRVAAAPEAPAMPAPAMMRTAVRSEPTFIPLRVPVTPASVRGSTIVLASNGPDVGDDELQQQPTRRREAAKVIYDREINRLRAIVDSGRTRMNPATVALLDRNLKIIDTAIEQCNEALVKDSSSTFLLESLNNAYQTKVKLLRIAAAAASRG